MVDKDLCVGCGVCLSICPDTFKLDDSGKSQAVAGKSCDDCDCEAAATSCPVGAISVKEV